MGRVMLVLLATVAHARDAAILCAERFVFEADDTREQVLQKGWFELMDPLDPGLATPTIDTLVRYDAVLVYPHADFLDPDALGDVLAEYLQAGGGVVLGYGAFSNEQGLGGAFTDHLPLLPGPAELGGVGLVPVIPDHPVLVGTTLFDAGAGHRTATAGLAPGAELVATWNDGVPLVVTRETAGGGRIVALNLMPSPDNVDVRFWDRNSDVDDLLARSLLWTTGYEWPFETACWAETMRIRDRNCNAIEAADEPPVDLTHPWCAQNVDPATGAPFQTQDEYVDYTLHGCRYPVTAFDPDGDGFGDGEIDIFGEDGFVDYVFVLGCDNCPEEPNPLQEDVDCDGTGDVCDPCVELLDSAGNDDGDPWGETCDLCPATFNLDAPLDRDGDEIADCNDNCPDDPNPLQENADGDSAGDVCDICPDDFDYGEENDGDGVGDACDNCPLHPNADQSNGDGDEDGDVCDRCPTVRNEARLDTDRDHRPDACDPCPLVFSSDPDADRDQDTIGDVCDLCPRDADPTNADTDGDGEGDSCDLCPAVASPTGDLDGDRFGDLCDVCPELADFQGDADGDGIGDACDACWLAPNDPDPPDRDGDGTPDVCDACPGEVGPVCRAVELRGGGRGCETGRGSAWLVLLILGVTRCSSRR